MAFFSVPKDRAWTWAWLLLVIDPVEAKTIKCCAGRGWPLRGRGPFGIARVVGSDGMTGRNHSRYRAAACALGALGAIGAIIWAESELWYCVNFLRQRAEIVSSQLFHLSDQFEARTRELHDDVFRYSLEATPERRVVLEGEMTRLQQWLEGHRHAPPTPAQREILVRAEILFTRYAGQVGWLLQTNLARVELPAWRAQTEGMLSEMLALARELNRVEKSALSEEISLTQRSMKLLERKLIISSLVLLSMGAVLGYLAYRGIIWPLQARLRQSQRAMEQREKLSSLGVLAAGVAHEIRNPLTSIKARLFTQQSLLADRSEALEDNVFITEEISRLEKIVADFLAFARPSEPQMISLPATQSFRDLEALFRPALSKANIQLKTEFEADPVLQADPAQLKQVLINLVRNAAESIGRDGVITLRTRTEVRPRAKPPATVAILEVEDTGEGIPPEVQKRLFDPFFTTKPSGTGLGLSIAARILEKHGGTLEFKTEPKRGTTFRLVLPITPRGT